MTQGHVIDVRAVRRTFGSGANAFTALDSVSVGIRENEFFTLLGPSGCGKTTLLRLIAGFDFPTDGSILLQGQDIALLPPFKRPVNTVFQSYALFPHMTAAQNIGFGLKMQDWPKAKIAARVDEMLRLVRLEALAGRRASEMSGGQQQRVALARALAPQPKVLLLDEPLSALDYKLRKEMQIELKRLQLDTGITFIFVTHDQEEALTMSDRIAVMSKGRILQVGTPRQIYDQPADRFVAGFIGESNLLPAVLVTAEGDDAVLRLAGGESLRAGGASGLAPGAQVAVMVRPEHAALVPAGQPDTLSGTLAEVVYFGTDTHFHVALDDGSRFVLRRQNSRQGAALRQTGDRVGIAIEDGAARVLADPP